MPKIYRGDVLQRPPPLVLIFQCWYIDCKFSYCRIHIAADFLLFNFMDRVRSERNW